MKCGAGMRQGGAIEFRLGHAKHYPDPLGSGSGHESGDLPLIAAQGQGDFDQYSGGDRQRAGLEEKSVARKVVGAGGEAAAAVQDLGLNTQVGAETMSFLDCHFFVVPVQ